MTDNAGQVSETMAERTRQVIRQRIMESAPGYTPDARLYPSSIAIDLGTSGTPVREALRLLTAEGLVVLSPRRGARVANPSKRELDDLAVVQEGLEEFALSLMRGSPSQNDVEQLEWCLDAGKEALARGDTARTREMSAEFHRRLVARAKNAALANLYGLLLNSSQILEVFYPRSVEDHAKSIAEHRRLVAALSVDVSRGQRALARHWTATRRRMEKARVGLRQGGDAA